MPRKKKRQKQPTLRSRIVSLIIERGPTKLRDMTGILAARYRSLNTEALELRRLGVLEKDSEGAWSLVPGVNAATFGIQLVPSYQAGGDASGSISPPSTPVSSPDASRTPQDDFMETLASTGVKKAVLSIADIFFSGDINDTRWLYHVLSWSAEGFVTEAQCKLMMAWWASHWGIPYDHDDFFDN